MEREEEDGLIELELEEDDGTIAEWQRRENRGNKVCRTGKVDQDYLPTYNPAISYKSFWQSFRIS